MLLYILKHILKQETFQQLQTKIASGPNCEVEY